MRTWSRFIPILAAFMAPGLALAQPCVHPEARSNSRFGSSSREVTLSRVDFKDYYRFLDEIFAPLAAAQNQLSGGALQSCLVIVDSERANAWVTYTSRMSGPEKTQEPRVYLTTRIVEEFLSQVPGAGMVPRTPEETRAAVKRLAGVIAHELAHPLEQFESSKASGSERGYGSTIASRLFFRQASEIFADLKGQMIGAMAGFGQDAVYHTLRHLFWDDSPDRDLGVTVTKTHPENQLRTTTASVSATAERHEHGFSDDSRLMRYSQLPAEFVHAVKTQSAYSYHPAGSLAETMSRLEAIGDFKREELKKLEFSLLMKQFNHYLGDGQGVSREELERARKVVAEVVFPQLGERLSFLDRKAISKNFAHRTIPADILDLPDQVESVRALPFYREQALEKELKRNFRKSAQLATLPEILAPGQVTTGGFREDFAEHFKKSVSQSPEGGARRSLESFARGFPAEMRPPLHQIFLESLGEEEKAKLLFYLEEPATGVPAPWLEFLPVHRAGKPTDWSRSRGKPEVRALLLKRFQYFWENRAYFGMIDLLLPKETLDWPQIWEALGIQPDLGRSELIRSVKQFTREERYARLLKTLQEMDAEAKRYAALSESEKSALNFKGDGIRTFVNGLGRNKKLPFWADSTLVPYLAGVNLPATSGAEGASLQEFARGFVAKPVLEQDRGELAKRIVLQAKASLQSKGGGENWTSKSVENALRESLRKNGLDQLWLNKNVVARFVDQSRQSPETVALILKAQFLKGQGWFFTEGEAAFLEIQSLLKKHQLSSSVLGTLDLFMKEATPLFIQDKRPMTWMRSAPVGVQGYFQGVLDRSRFLMRDFAVELRSQATAAERVQLMKRASSLFFEGPVPLGNGASANGPWRSKEFRKFRQSFLEAIASEAFSREDRLALFKTLTATGPNSEGDRIVQPLLSAGASWSADPELRKLALAGKFQNLDTNARFAREIIDSDVAGMTAAEKAAYFSPPPAPQRSFSRDEPALAKNAQAIVDRLLPGASGVRDQLLEDVSWKYGLRGKILENFNEARKSTNFRTHGKGNVNLGSGIAEAIQKADDKIRLQLLTYLVESPPGEGLPESIVTAMESLARQDETVRMLLCARSDGEERLEVALLDAREKLEEFQLRATQFEKVPALDLLINSGRPGLAQHPDFPRNLTGRFLGYAPNSLEEKALNSFLRVIPENEKTASLAYLLAQPKSGQSSILNIFGAFRAPGYKAAQQMSLWRVFNEKLTKELDEAKDMTPPLGLYEVEDILKRTMSEKEFSRIASFDRVLGSASIKTVVQVTLADGRQVAIAVQRPGAAGQIRANLRIARDFFLDLEKSGVEIPGGMFKAIVTDLEAQMNGELDFKAEARMLRIAADYYESENTRLAADLHGYRFKVPLPVRGFNVYDNVLVMDLAAGDSFRKAPKSVTGKLGRAVARSTLGLYYRHGWMESDRHRGNFFVDEKTRTISVLDVAQGLQTEKAGMLVSDDRYLVSQFIRSVAEGDTDRIVINAKRMGQLRKGVADAFLHAAVEKAKGHGAASGQDKELSMKFIHILSGLEDAGLHMDPRFTLNALKGHLTIAAENYVPTSEFEAILKEEITRHLQKDKGFLTLAEEENNTRFSGTKPSLSVMDCVKSYRSIWERFSKSPPSPRSGNR